MYVFTSRDILCVFRDGARTGEKQEIEILFSGASLEILRMQEINEIRARKDLAFRRGNTMSALASLSWFYSNKDLPDFVQEFLTWKSTSTEYQDFCESPNDYNDPFWTKNNITISNDGFSPNGQTIAQRLTPTDGTRGYIQASVDIPLGPGEFVYYDFWIKTNDPHTTLTECEITAHGVMPPPAYAQYIDATTRWKKITGGTHNASATHTTETFTCRIHTSTRSDGKSIDLWGVSIRKEKAQTKTFDLFVDVYKGNLVDRSIVVPDVAYESLDFAEDFEGVVWNLDLISRKGYLLEV